MPANTQTTAAFTQSTLTIMVLNVICKIITWIIPDRSQDRYPDRNAINPINKRPTRIHPTALLELGIMLAISPQDISRHVGYQTPHAA
jgi:hypothetical protein